MTEPAGASRRGWLILAAITVAVASLLLPVGSRAASDDAPDVTCFYAPKVDDVCYQSLAEKAAEKLNERYGGKFKITNNSTLEYSGAEGEIEISSTCNKNSLRSTIKVRPGAVELDSIKICNEETADARQVALCYGESQANASDLVGCSATENLSDAKQNEPVIDNIAYERHGSYGFKEGGGELLFSVVIGVVILSLFFFFLAIYIWSRVELFRVDYGRLERRLSKLEKEEQGRRQEKPEQALRDRADAATAVAPVKAERQEPPKTPLAEHSPVRTEPQPRPTSPPWDAPAPTRRAPAPLPLPRMKEPLPEWGVRQDDPEAWLRYTYSEIVAGRAYAQDRSELQYPVIDATVADNGTIQPCERAKATLWVVGLASGTGALMIPDPVYMSQNLAGLTGGGGGVLRRFFGTAFDVHAGSGGDTVVLQKPARLKRVDNLSWEVVARGELGLRPSSSLAGDLPPIPR